MKDFIYDIIKVVIAIYIAKKFLDSEAVKLSEESLKRVIESVIDSVKTKLA